VYSVPVILAATGTGLVDTNLGQFRQQWLELIPDPFGQNLAGRVLQSGNVIQIVVIQPLIQRLEDGFDLGEVPDPPGVGIHVTREMEADLE
jgi:hypothetical protein